ncbi:preprotein translocase subunit SCY2, chloroplastic isoform X2 [Rhododendron vialii]|uniref:preprotein translocase subunit SCY2, chloroplastic isoform X2 n=1 Tax=Rhododendron vialii TaxID=182163 RepID=UPI00265DF0A2|nr:preprotein translocase subunit SCY2, chloroplastic isoform X2 [Rhododendron vialii]
MDATPAISHPFTPKFLCTKHLNGGGGKTVNCSQFRHLSFAQTYKSCKINCSGFSRRPFVVLNEPFSQKANRRFCIYVSNDFRGDNMSVGATSSESQNPELLQQKIDAAYLPSLHDIDNAGTFQSKPRRFKNRFLNILLAGSLLNNAAESFFKSEIRRRLFVTALLIVISRVGYFIPLPGFDRRLIPKDYLTFVSGSVGELGDFTGELKLSLFQLGISPQIGASILMNVFCYFLPSFVKLRKEGLDANEKIKSYIWWLSLAFAIVGGLSVAYYSLPYSVYAASHRVKHVMVTSFLLVCGAMTMTWICDKITESGFGQGSSLIICVGILTGYMNTLHNMLSQLTGSAVYKWPYILAILGVFTLVTMWAVVVAEGYRKVKLQYYGFKLASASSLLGSPFWEHVKEILNPETSLGAEPWVYYSIYAFFIFLFNIVDIANTPKEIADYLIKMGARVPNIKPGKATIKYLTKIQASTRFWGGLLLCFLATSSSILDHYLRRINEGFAIGFTSVLIIVGSIIELRRSYQAYNVTPSLRKVLKRYGV